MLLVLQPVFEHLDPDSQFSDLLPDLLCLLLSFQVPLVEQLRMLALFTLLLQLFGKFFELAAATQVQVPELEIDDDAVDPLRIEQQLLELFQPLFDTRRDAPLLLDALLQPVRLVAEVGELLLELGPVPVELQQLFAVLARLFAGTAENRGKARHDRFLDIIPPCQSGPAMAES